MQRHAASALALAGILTLGARHFPVNAADLPGVYVVPQMPACDQDTPEGGETLWTLLEHGAAAVDKTPAWTALSRAAADHPDSVPAALSLARCYYTFYRGFSKPPHADDVDRLLSAAVAGIHRARTNETGAPDVSPARAGAPMRVGYGGPPARTRDKPPVYPKAALASHVTGTVFLDVTIDPSGSVKTARVVGSIPALDKAALDCVRQWKFERTVTGEKNTSVIKTVAVKFGDSQTTAVDAIDEAGFHFAQHRYLVAEAMLTQVMDAIRRERATPGAPSALESLLTSGAPVYRAGGAIHQPEILSQPEPRYTSAAMKAKIQGDVELAAVVLPNGLIGPVHVTKSLDPVLGLDLEAIKSVRQWRFRPAMKDDAPVPVIVTLVLTFRLH